jgi:uncharacterized surface protein with fasciclin (FAS1) repeats
VNCHLKTILATAAFTAIGLMQPAHAQESAAEAALAQIAMVVKETDGTGPSREHGLSLQALMDSRPDLSIFTHALRQSGIWERLEGGAPVIVLAPSDRAMDAEGSTFLLDQVLLTDANAERLKDLIALHVVPGSSSLEGLVDDGEIGTLDGVCMPLFDEDGRLRIGPQAFVVEQHLAEGGRLYVIDHLLWRPWQGEDPCEFWRS